jgi:tripartite-type tricarboxylate transporter receptor subunit TctC
MKRFLALGLAALAIVASGSFAADRYPDKPIRIIVPFTPGTGIDILARTLGQKLGEAWNVSIVVENKPGASGNIGTEAAARSAPDGYTLLTTANTIVLNRSLFKSIPYDPIKDFEPVAPLAIGRLALVTHPGVPAKSVQELIALAKREPGRLNYGSPGNGTPHHLAMELFKAKTGIELVHVPYKGSAGAVSDLIAGRIQVMFLPVHVALPFVHDGKLHMLAAGGVERATATPEVPSLAEAAGIRDIDTDIWYGIYAPAATPKAIVDTLNAEINALLKAPDTAAALEKQGLQPTGGSPEELGRVTRADLERWSAVVREAKIHAD